MDNNLKLFLVGMPGSGKSSMGKVVADFLSVKFVDMDEEIEKKSGSTIKDIFRIKGEKEFRKLERELLREISENNDEMIVSTGGGIICDPENREILKKENTVYLECNPEKLLKRIETDDDKRPLISNPEKDLLRLFKERREYYELYERFTPFEFKTEKGDKYSSNMKNIPGLIYSIKGFSKYHNYEGFNIDFVNEIKIIPGLFSEIKSVYKEAFCVTSETVNLLYGNLFPAKNHIVPDGEKAKKMDELEKIWHLLLESEYRRNQTLIAVGGGTVTDLGGFAASTFKRGMKFNSFPTTLLAQVDASIGGKNGINFDGVKNMVGTFYQPEEVLIDPIAVLSTGKNEIINGLVEGLKVCLILHENEEKLEERLDLSERILKRPTLNDLKRFIKLSVEDKLNVIKDDMNENGKRKFLNLGHTLGHAYEIKYGISHGKAVALGMIKVLGGNRHSGIRKYIDFFKEITKDNFHVIEDGIDESVVKNMMNDKKNLDKDISFIMLEKPGSPFLKSMSEKEIKSFFSQR